MLIVRLLFQTVMMLLVMAVLLFGAAGTMFWPAGWIFITEMGLSSLLISFWLLAKDPALLAERLSPPVSRNQTGWDRLFMLAALVAVCGWFAIMGWDAGRTHRGAVAPPFQAVGAVLIGLCMTVCWLAFRFNTFAAPTVKVQAERGQHVITKGPYRLVRHPMYAGAMLYFVGVPLLLGSWVGLMLSPVLVVGVAARAVAEEAVLRNALSGYGAYAAKVRYRLIPGVW
ncbi:MAG TPA: isoprenylcysteine carboxylmethyltransferase family protein [Caulobacteraceae bacterium]